MVRNTATVAAEATAAAKVKDVGAAEMNASMAMAASDESAVVVAVAAVVAAVGYDGNDDVASVVVAAAAAVVADFGYCSASEGECDVEGRALVSD